MKIQKSINYVYTQGNVVEKARLSSILLNKKSSPEVIKDLALLQKPDGGFSYWVKNVSNITDTCYVLEWFDDLKLHKGEVIDSAC
ncbi:MAG: hypothetical protein ACFFBK_10625, partial [Promethearchaeota archaeon]